MNVVLLGPPGAGKGTQAKRLAQKRSWIHLSTGDLLRDAVSHGTDLGLKAKEYMNRGALVPDGVMVEMIRSVLPRTGDFVLDGFPRTEEQARSLDTMLQKEGREIKRVVNLDVDDEEVSKRLSGRRQCEAGHIFNVFFTPSRDGSRCDVCGKELARRADDEPETVHRRLAVYRSQTAPLIEFYRAQGKLDIVAGDASTDRVFLAIEKALEN